MLKFVRIVLAIVCFTAVLCIFALPPAYNWSGLACIAKLQFIPALLSLNFMVIASLVLATLVFGRIYCSVICPLGVYQDIVSRITIWCSGKKRRNTGTFKYSKPRTAIRYSMLAVFVVLLVSGMFAGVFGWIASLVEPYSAFGRMASCFLKPLVAMANNGLAERAATNGSYDFIEFAVATYPLWIAVVAAVTLIVVTVFAAMSGRGYCNTVCPVGTVLGWMAKFSILRPVIDTEKCIKCGKCARKCKASCIDSKNHCIDYSRCVACMDCIGNCKDGAIRYARPSKTGEHNAKSATDTSRRNFLLGTALVAGHAVASAMGDGDGGLAPLNAKQKALRKTPVTPPGAKGNKWLAQHCTACQLCISRCPNQVLSASTDMKTFMQPVMDFSKGYCRPECTVCSDVCPAGAILPINVEQKTAVKIGTAVVDAKTCLMANGHRCGRCAKGCPTGAIKIVETAKGHVPVVNAEKCIGCGACEYHCPVGTVEAIAGNHAAIHVEGVERHHSI